MRTGLKVAFDVPCVEGSPHRQDQPTVLSVGLHCRRAGCPGRFLDYIQQHDKVWITRRIDIAWHWRATPPEY